MENYYALRSKLAGSKYKHGDVLVLFGELFPRGYANGLVEHAKVAGLQIIYATVGRREKDGSLRALNAEELAVMPKPLINIPLEAGFDLEKDAKGLAPVDQLKEVRLSAWQEAKMDFAAIEESRISAKTRFTKSVQRFLKELEPMIPSGKQVLFAHLMAGGVPRTKIVMPLMNRSFKGTGDRFLASEDFWKSDIGKFCDSNFFEVTAETFNVLIHESASLREKIQKSGGSVAYLGYGYHGTEILQNGKYRWQTYSPYLQGWAKMRLEQYAKEATLQGIRATIYNCPEILTASSSIFQGVEVCLYTLLGALMKDAKNPGSILSACKERLKSEYSIEQMMAESATYLDRPEIKATCIYEKWPQHNTREQLETLLNISERLFTFHKNEKEQISPILSEVVVKGCGELMFNTAGQLDPSSVWLNHDVIARCF